MGTQQPHEAARHHFAVLEPHVEQVAQDVDLRRILCRFVQEGHDAFLADQAGGMVRYAQVEVGEEVDLLFCAHPAGPPLGQRCEWVAGRGR
jgi:hypothetical protein